MIADYTIYDAATGRRIQTGRADTTLVEMQPGMFVEISVELARERNIGPGEKVIVKSARGEVEAPAETEGLKSSWITQRLSELKRR